MRLPKTILAIVLGCLLVSFTLADTLTQPPNTQHNEVACWYPGKRIVQRRRAARYNGGWYLGKNVQRLRGRFGGCR